MSFNGSGTFSRVYSWAADKLAGTKVTASRMDTEMDGFATGLSNVLTRDGQTTPTANLSMGGFRLTNVGTASSSTDALSRSAADSLYTRFSPPGGRLTLTTAAPVMTSDVTAGTTIYYTSYLSNLIPFYDGSVFASSTFSELSLAPSPSADTTYDVFVYLVTATPTLKLAAWTNDTTRATALTRVNGIWLNATSISSGPAASRGTYLGTVRTNGSSNFRWVSGGTSAGGTPAWLGVWNLYNRVKTYAYVADSTESWTYSSATWHDLNESTSNRVTFVQGLAEDAVKAQVSCGVNSHLGTDVCIGLGVARPTDSDGTRRTPDGIVARGSSDPDTLSVTAFYAGVPGIGSHIVQALQSGDASTAAFAGSASQGQLCALIVEIMA